MYKYFKTTWVPVQVPSTTSPWPQNFWLALRFVHIFYTLKRRTQLIGVYCKTWNSWMHSNFANWLNSQNLIPANPVSNWTLELPLQLCLTNFPVNMGVATGGGLNCFWPLYDYSYSACRICDKLRSDYCKTPLLSWFDFQKICCIFFTNILATNTNIPQVGLQIADIQ